MKNYARIVGGDRVFELIGCDAIIGETDYGSSPIN